MQSFPVQLANIENKTIHDLFEDMVAANPDAIAVVWGKEQLTYGELNEKANRMAHTIRDFYRSMYGLEFSPDTPVGLHVNQGPHMLVGLLGILKAGGAYLPLDPAIPKPDCKG